MNILSRNKVLAAGIALILLTNIVVLAGAIANRSGKPEAVLNLTERELILRDWHMKENSGLSLRLNWNDHFYYGDGTRRLLDADKLKELGFALIDSDDPYKIRQYISKQLPRAAWIVLEFDGAAYQEALKDAENKYQEELRLLPREQDSATQKSRLEQAEGKLEWMKNSASRLYAVDAGLDPAQLRHKYPDTSHYIVTSGVVAVSYDDRDHGKITGYISDINVTSIHVPLEQRAVFDALPEVRFTGKSTYYPRSFHPRYLVNLAYGRRYEPWIVSVEAIGDQGKTGSGLED
jgi:hypothetical protein